MSFFYIVCKIFILCKVLKDFVFVVFSMNKDVEFGREKIGVVYLMVIVVVFCFDDCVFFLMLKSCLFGLFFWFFVIVVYLFGDVV